MLLELLSFEENEDGSVKAVLNTDKEATRILLEYGLTAILREAIKNQNPQQMVMFDDNQKT